MQEKLPGLRSLPRGIDAVYDVVELGIVLALGVPHRELRVHQLTRHSDLEGTRAARRLARLEHDAVAKLLDEVRAEAVGEVLVGSSASVLNFHQNLRHGRVVSRACGSWSAWASRSAVVSTLVLLSS